MKMIEERKLELLAAVAGGSIIKVWEDKDRTHPWSDFRGRSWSNDEIREGKKLGLLRDIPTVNFTHYGMQKLKEATK